MRKEIPPPLELQCLKALWRLGEGNVHHVRGWLELQGRALAYTTVMTLLDRLHNRGMVKRRKIGRQFVYEPDVSREALRQEAVQVLLEDFFEGQKTLLQQYLHSGAFEDLENDRVRREAMNKDAAQRTQAGSTEGQPADQKAEVLESAATMDAVLL